MIQGIYTATQGMSAHVSKQDQIANNLANINTTGFKQSGSFTKAYQKYLSNDTNQVFANRQIKVDDVYVDYRQGAPKQTNSNLDFFIEGDGFFKVMTSEGVRYTRNGNFSLNPDGLVVTSDGSKVMGTEGFIRVEPDLPITVSSSGEFIQKGESKGVLNLVDFPKPYEFLRCGNSRFKPVVPGQPELRPTQYTLRQGYLESSNVDIIRNMVNMISAHRNYEADQKALHAQDETLQKAVNEIARIG